MTLNCNDKIIDFKFNNEEIKIYNLSNKFIGLLTFDNSKKFWKPKNIIK